MPPAHDDTVDVACFSPRRAIRAKGVRGQRIDERFARAVQVGTLPVADPVSIWCMVAPSLSVHDAVALGDAVIRIPRIPGSSELDRPPLANFEDLERAALLPYRRGRDKLCELLPLLSPHSASAPESHLRLRLAEWGLPQPALDHDVRDADGTLIGCSEIAYPELRVAFEYEGDHHRTDRAQWHRDIEKYAAYRRAGWFVVRVTADLLYRRPELLREFAVDALVRRGWRPTRAT